MIKLSIVVPCYNEEKNIPLIVERFSEVIKRNDIEVILVDNGSNDNSAEVLANLVQKYYFKKKVKVKINKDNGNGICKG